MTLTVVAGVGQITTMSLRTKTLWLIGGTMLVLLVVLSVSSYYILRASFASQEEKQAYADMQRVRQTVASEMLWLERFVSDWGNWDEADAFVRGHNPSFARRELTTSTLRNLHVNLIVFLDARSHVVDARIVDPQTQRAVPVPQTVLVRLREYRDVLCRMTPRALSGIVMLPGGPALFAISPVRSSSRRGASNGMLLMGRYLDPTLLHSLSNVTNYPLSITIPPADTVGMSWVPPGISLHHPILIRRTSAQSLSGFCLYTDIHGRPAFLLRVAMPRTMFLQGLRSSHYLILMLSVVGCCFGAVVLCLLEYLVLRRLMRFERQVRHIGGTGNLQERLHLPRHHDELSRLATAINRMLGELAAAQRQNEAMLLKSNEALEAQVSARTLALRESEERFRRLFEENHAVMLLLDPENGSIVDANPAACAFYGYAKPDLLARKVFEIDTLAADEVAQLLALASSECRYFSFRHRLANGEIRDVDVYSGPLAFQDRILLCSIVFDVTERRRVAEELDRQRAYLEAAIDTLPVPLVMLAFSEKRCRKNRAEIALCARLGVSDMRDAQMLDPKTGETVPFSHWPLQRALRGETVTSTAYILQGANGMRIDVLADASPILLNGEVVAAVRAFEDITPLKEADHAKDEFIAVLSHELQTPLTSILGWSDLALGREDPVFLRQAMGVVHRNARRQHRLVKDLLDMSKLLHQKLEVSLQPVEVAQQVHQAVESLQHEVAQWGGRLQVEPSAMPILARADLHRLQQCLCNLLQNSMKFTPAHGRITVRCLQEEEHAVIEVSDTGRGITPDALPTLIAPFQQVDRDERVGGLGLGLSIVHGIMALHGGRVTATSAGVNRGSTFRLEFPLHRVAEETRAYAPLLGR